MAFARVAWSPSPIEALRLHSLLAAAGFHPARPETGAHGTIVGAEQGYHIEVLRGEAEKAIAFLVEQGQGRSHRAAVRMDRRARERAGDWWIMKPLFLVVGVPIAMCVGSTFYWLGLCAEEIQGPWTWFAAIGCLVVLPFHWLLCSIALAWGRRLGRASWAVLFGSLGVALLLGVVLPPLCAAPSHVDIIAHALASLLILAVAIRATPPPTS